MGYFVSPYNLSTLQQLQNETADKLNTHDVEIAYLEIMLEQKTETWEELKKAYERAEFEKKDAARALQEWQDYLTTFPDGGSQSYSAKATELIMKASEANSKAHNAEACMKDARNEVMSAEADLKYEKRNREQTANELTIINEDIIKATPTIRR